MRRPVGRRKDMADRLEFSTVDRLNLIINGTTAVPRVVPPVMDGPSSSSPSAVVRIARRAIGVDLNFGFLLQLLLKASGKLSLWAVRLVLALNSSRYL